MGIREYFEKQLCEEDLKFGDIVVEDEVGQGSEFDFDYEALMSDDDWKRLHVLFSEAKSSYGAASFCDKMVDVKILFPDRVDDFDLGEDTFSWANYYVQRLYDDHSLSFAKRFLELKMIFSDRKIELEKNISESVIDEMRSGLHSVYREGKSSNNMSALVVYGAYFRAVFPDQFSELAAELWNENKFFDLLKKQLDDDKKKKNWRSFGYFAKHLRFLFPDRFKSLGIDGAVFSEMRKFIEEKKLGWFVLMANYKILVADEIEFDKDGLRIINKTSSFLKKQTGRPERKSF